MKILVYGAGVLGSFYAARLHKAGQEVTLLARGQRLAELREHGVLLEDGVTGEQTSAQVSLVEQLAPEDAYDLVLVIMRKNQVPGVLPALAANGHTPNVVFMGNNAAGPWAWVEALGRERVVLGFGGAGGVRRGPVIRCVAASGEKQAAVTLGEIGGRATPRLAHIAAAFEGAGIPVRTSPKMDAWLKTHVALILPIALSIYLAGGDNYRLARTRDGIVLGIRAVREGFRVLHALGIPVTPPSLRRLAWMPEPLLVRQAQKLLDTELAELGLAGHANAARDEMQCLAGELRALALTTSVATPALELLYTYLDPATYPMPEGSAEMPLDWRAVWVAGGALAGAVAGMAAALRRAPNVKRQT